MRASTKLILSAWVVLLLLVGGIIYGAYSRLKPEVLISLLQSQVVRNYPGTEMKIESYEYGFALDFDLDIHGLNLLRNGRRILIAENLQLKVPWWLILLNRGSAQINISGLTVFLASDVEANSKSSSVKSKSDNQKIELILPEYLLDAQYTLRAKNISIRDIQENREILAFSKLLVREFQINKNSAFEMNIPIRISHKNRNFNSDLWLFGDLTPSSADWRAKFRGEFKTKESAEGVKFEELVIDGQSTFDVAKLDFETNLNLFIDKKVVGKGHLSAHDHVANFNLDFSRFPIDYLNFIGDEIRNPYWKELDGLADGNISFKRDFQKDSIALKAQLNFPGSFNISPELTFDGKWTLNFENEKWETIFITPKGEISFFRRAFLDFEKSEVKQFSQEVGVTALDSKVMVALISNWEKSQNTSEKAYFNSVISFKKIQDSDNVFNGTYKVGKTPIEKFYQLKLDSGSSSLDLNILEKGGNKNLQLVANKFGLMTNYHFLSPFLDLNQGLLSGTINGRWETKWTDGNWKIDFKLTNFTDIKGKIHKLIEDSFAYFNHDLSTAQVISINSQWLSGDVFIQGLELVKPTSHYLLKGILSKNKKSELVLVNSLKKKNKPLSKEVTDKFWMSENL